MNKFSVGQRLMADGKLYTVIGYIVYSNLQNGESWTEYRMLSAKNEETWLSVDNENGEYSISWPTVLNNGQIPAKWKKVDEGTQMVVNAVGDVDVDVNETADFIEHEDETEEEILSVEVWPDGTEVSEGFYLDENEVYPFNKPAQKGGGCSGCAVMVLVVFLILAAQTMFFGPSKSPAYDYIKSSSNYQYVTAITGNEKQKAYVYESVADPNSVSAQELKNLESQMSSRNELSVDPNQAAVDPKIDFLVKDLIVNANLNIEYVTENKETKDSVAVLTDKEYCLFYHPETDPSKVYVQVSDRKYNYSSNVAPYAATMALNSWYRSHYYSSAFFRDSARWSGVPSAYDMHQGPIVKDLGNGYYDVYSNDVRRSSVMQRESMGGGHSAGK